MLSVDVVEFGRAFMLLRDRFPDAMLRGRQIRWQTRQPDRDRAVAADTLAAGGLGASIEIQPLSMEDTFVSVVRDAGLDRA